jgi:TRAP-type C4-dicarboxylate transport system permease small subunit
VGAPDMYFEDPDASISDIKWIDAPGIIVFWVLAIVVFLQFFTRYVLNDSLAWTEEVARYLLVLVCFLGSISVIRRASSIMLEVMIRRTPPAVSKAIAVFAELTTFGFFAWLTWISVELTQKTRQQMITLPVPKAWIYAICIVSLALMTIYSAIWLWRKIRFTPRQIIEHLDENISEDS